MPNAIFPNCIILHYFDIGTINFALFMNNFKYKLIIYQKYIYTLIIIFMAPFNFCSCHSYDLGLTSKHVVQGPSTGRLSF